VLPGIRLSNHPFKLRLSGSHSRSIHRDESRVLLFKALGLYLNVK